MIIVQVVSSIVTFFEFSAMLALHAPPVPLYKMLLDVFVVDESFYLWEYTCPSRQSSSMMVRI